MTEPYKFTVTSRTIRPTWGFYRKLKTKFEALNLGTFDQVECVFGAVRVYTPLYGGRPYRAKHSLPLWLVKRLANRGINMSLTLSNHHFTEDAYRQTIPLLEKLHRKGNSLVICNDDLAKRVRKDFPFYELKASVVKRITTLDEINKNLELYDYVVLLPVLNDNISLLQSIECKERIILFASVRCLYNCNSEDCFQTISDSMTDKPPKERYFCKNMYSPAMKKLKVFDLKEERFNGFNYFKISSFVRED